MQEITPAELLKRREDAKKYLAAVLEKKHELRIHGHDLSLEAMRVSMKTYGDEIGHVKELLDRNDVEMAWLKELLANRGEGYSPCVSICVCCNFLLFLSRRMLTSLCLKRLSLNCG